MERAFLFEVKPEGLTEYSPGREHWDKDLIIFLALKGRQNISLLLFYHPFIPSLRRRRKRGGYKFIY